MNSNIRLIASRLIRDGYAYIKMPETLNLAFNQITKTYESVDNNQKQAFSFPEKTDGFLPLGSEYASSPERPDLCERFCYWSGRRELHRGFDVTDSDFYKGVSAYETAVNPIAQDLLDAVCQNLGGPAQPRVKDSSYLQFCAYKPDLRRAEREYLQDPHEDGHLLTFIKPTSPGLMLFTREGLVPATPAADEMVVLAGSLLEVLTDGEVRAMHHAVKKPDAPVFRKSLMYFVNPNWAVKNATSLVNNQQVDLARLADLHHMGFGNNQLNVGIR
ncbi:Uncharacterised protein [Serratia quinivorans]|uniref:2OG-Fe(II) oxygenase family protein n=1 Tax=Serratia quinivorans TaxID=137545 RepID=A0ABV3UGK9_9GAMM|nr:2OG-Fe(II) oxygenase family protein [Serratia quinivorans]CAI1722813.1 Uncharacterised protein [Serratia quinivorans]